MEWIKRHYVLVALIICLAIFIGFFIYAVTSEPEPEIFVLESTVSAVDSETAEIIEITETVDTTEYLPANPDWRQQKIPVKLLNNTLAMDSLVYNEPEKNQPFICGTPDLDKLYYVEIESPKYNSENSQEPITPVAVKKDDGSADIPEPYFKVNDYQREVLIHLLYFEACGCKTPADVLEQHAVVSVVFNRFTSGDYKGCYDLEDIVKYKYPSGAFAFSPAKDWNRFWNFRNADEKKDFNRNYKQLAEKVDYVIQHGPTVPENVKYFVSNACYAESKYFKNNHKVYAIYDDTTFMTDEKP